MSIIFFGAGISKLRHSGIEWVTSDNMAILLIEFNYRTSPLTSWGLYVAQHSWLCHLLAASTIVLEVGYPLALFSRRARWVVVSGMALIQIGIILLMGPGFRRFLICYLFWIPWDRVGLTVRAIGAVGVIMIVRPGWANKIARLVGIESDAEVFVYLTLAGITLISLIYYSALWVIKSQKQI
jgi:hypothetical protein